MTRAEKLGFVMVLALTLGACAQNTTVTDAAKVADTIGHIKPSRADTCETQKQIAAQSSRIDTIKDGKEVVYRADCKAKG